MYMSWSQKKASMSLEVAAKLPPPTVMTAADRQSISPKNPENDPVGVEIEDGADHSKTQ
jgi:hypothetical protein